MIECMSMKQVWMGIAVCLCLSCTQMRGGQEGVVLDLTEKGADTLGFSDVFDVVGVVPLETKNECLLGHVSKVEVVDGNYYMLDGQRKVVFVFDGQGAFLRRIGIMGHGHGEYERASDFTVDRDRRRVVILCGPREVYMYDLQGQFVGKKDVGPWWVWKIASCPEGFVGSTEDATYSEGEMAYLFYAFDPEFHVRGKWVGVRRDYAMPMAYPPLQKAGCKVFGFDGARNAVHVWDGQADSVRTAYTVRFASPMPEGMKSQEEYMRNMFLYDVLMGGAWGGDGLVLFYLHEARQHVAVFAPDGERRVSGPYRDVFPDLYVGREGEVLIVLSAARFLELVRRHPDAVPGVPVTEDGNHVVLRCRLE